MKLGAGNFTTDTYIVRLDCVNRMPGERYDVSYHKEYIFTHVFLRKLDEDGKYARV